MQIAQFGIDAYPTTRSLISTMLAGIDLRDVGSILEPSAGKGDIAMALRERYDSYRYTSRHGIDLDCIEIDTDLQNVLKGHELRVVHDDFLTYQTFKRYGLIIANPPFSTGEHHLLKMLEMQRRGGKIRCLLNAETIRHPYSNARKDLVRKLTDLSATIEYIPNAFADAERKTSVEVAFISVDIPMSSDGSIILEGLRQAAEAEQAALETSNQMVHAEVIQQFVARYEVEAKGGITFINEYERLKPYMLTRAGDGCTSTILNLYIGSHHQAETPRVNTFISQLRSKYWHALLAHEGFTGILTSELRDKYMAKIATLADYEFSFYNIYTLRAEFSGMALAGIDKAITDLFDELSYRNSFYGSEYEKNIWMFTGWKTNLAWCINKKVILPCSAIEKEWFGKGHKISYGSKALSHLSDIEKVFSYLEGKPDPESTTRTMIEDAVRGGQTSGIDTTYFTVTFYQKGTTHVKFKRLDLLKKFNLYGSQKKKWLPPSYGRTTYADMSREEQSVVDSFEGEAEYAKTMARTDFYLVKPEMLLTGSV